MMMFNSPAINCFDICDSSIDDSLVVYHYTSAEAFYSIIDNHCIRFANLRYMNDKSEKIFFIKRLIEFCDKRKKDFPDFCQVVDLVLKGNDYESLKNASVQNIKFNEIKNYPYRPFRTFIFCSCCEPDLLNMWNYYVNNSQYSGYSIGFSLYKLLKTFDLNNKLQYDKFFIYYGKIVYDKKEQFNQIELLAENIENYISMNNSIHSSYKAAALDLRKYIDTKGAFFKSDKFSQEKEFRIVFGINNDELNQFDTFNGTNNKQITEGFNVKNGLIIPHLNITLPFDSISRITMSPMTEYEIAKESIKELLEKRGFKHKTNNSIPIFKSKIPIRF